MDGQYPWSQAGAPQQAQQGGAPPSPSSFPPQPQHGPPPGHVMEGHSTDVVPPPPPGHDFSMQQQYYPPEAQAQDVPPPPPPPAGAYEATELGAGGQPAAPSEGGAAPGWGGFDGLTEEQYAQMTPEQQAALWQQYEQYYGYYQGQEVRLC